MEDVSGGLFGMFSLINHSKNENIIRKQPEKRDDIVMVYAQRNIKKDEEITHDYAKDTKAQKRVIALSQWEINEWIWSYWHDGQSL